MICCHLGLGQLWSSGVQCGTVPSENAEVILMIKHSGSETLDFGKVSTSFPAWTVTCKFWEQALNPEIFGIAVDVRLFHESGRRLVHKYRVYQDPVPHPALCEGKITKLLSFVNRAMVIAQLTHLRIVIPSSGTPPGEVPSDCFPEITAPAVMKKGRRVAFSPVIQSTMEEVDLLTTDQDETTADSPMITIIEETEQTKAQETKPESTVSPPGYRPFQWPKAEWEQKGDATLDPGLNFVASWSARIMEERSSTPLSYRSLRSFRRRTPRILLWCKWVRRRPKNTNRRE